MHRRIKLVDVQRVFDVFIGSVHRNIQESGSVGGCAKDCKQQEEEQECQKHPEMCIRDSCEAGSPLALDNG